MLKAHVSQERIHIYPNHTLSHYYCVFGDIFEDIVMSCWGETRPALLGCVKPI